MRTKKLWSRVISMLLVIALLPVSALAEYTAEPQVVTDPKFTVTTSHVNPEYEHLGVKFTRPAADCMTMAEGTVDSLDEAADYLREQMEDRVTEVTIVVNNHTYVDGEGLKADWTTILYGAFEHTGVSTQGDYIIRHYGKANGQIGHNGVSTATFQYTITYDTTLEQENEVGDKIDELFEAWDEAYDFYDLSDYEQIEMIYDYICANVTYDDKNLNDPSYTLKYSAYAALIQGTAVCQGYANLFYRMALEAGVDNRIIVGDAGGAHAWNIVDLGEKYYYLDSTWDAPRFEYGYEYFLLGSDNFHADHTPDAEFWNDEFLAEYPIDTKNFDHDLWLIVKATEEKLLTYFENADLNSGLTRLDMAKLIAALVKLELDGDATLPYADCAGLTEQEKQIIAAVEKFGVMSAYNDGTFRPAETIDRARTALILYRAMNGNVDAEDIKDYADDGYFTDVESFTWYAPYVNYLASIGVIPAWADKTFDPDDTADLCTAVRWMVKAANYEKPGDPTEILASGYCGAEDDGTNLTWTLTEDGTLTISGEGEMENYDSGVTPWYDNHDTITSVVIEDGVTSIGNHAFNLCTSLASVEIPNSVTNMGEWAFDHCIGLTDIGLPDNLTSIGDHAFENCRSLTSVELPNSVANIGNCAFYSCRSLTAIELPDNLTSIGSSAFADCSSLTSITLPSGMTILDYAVFEGCSSLTSIELPNSMTSIRGCVFNGCSSLMSIKIPNSMTSIGNGAFNGCDSLTIVNYTGTEAQWTAIEIGIDNDPLLNATIVFAEGEHTHVYDDAVWKNDEENHWHECACGEKSGLAAHELEEVARWQDCKEPGGVIWHCTVCGYEYTEELPQLEHTPVTVSGYPATCTESGMTDGVECEVCGMVIEWPEEIPAKGHTEEVIPGKEPTLTEPGLTEGKKCADCGEIIVAQEEIPALEFIEGTCGETLTWKLTNEGVLTISGEGAMYNFSVVVDLLPQSVVPMGGEKSEAAPWSEYNGLIVQVVVEDGVTSIGDNAFAACENLTEVEIPETVTSIGDSVFAGCEALETVTYTGSEEQWDEIEIGAGNEVMEDIKVTIADIIPGDVNGDGSVNIFDAIELLDLIADGTADTLPSDEFRTADLNDDGSVNIFDAIKLLDLIASGTV